MATNNRIIVDDDAVLDPSRSNGVPNEPHGAAFLPVKC